MVTESLGASNCAITELDSVARDDFLSRYSGYTQKLYRGDMRIFFEWCDDNGISPLRARRRDLERFVEHMATDRGNRPSSIRRRMYAVRGFYALAVDDEVIDRDPTRLLRLPRAQRDIDDLVWLDRFQVGSFLRAAQEAGPSQHALIGLMAIGGLRVSAACGAMIENIQLANGVGMVLRVREKNDNIHSLEVPPQLSAILQSAIGDRTSGTIIVRKNGKPQDRNGAYAWCRLLGQKIGMPKVNPHAFRRAAITAVIDGGGSIQDACAFAGHANISTTQLYHPTRGSRNASGTFFTAAAFSPVS